MKAKKSPEHIYLPEPKHAALRVGIKVTWLYFKTEEEAKAAAIIANHNAKVAMWEGYDFGYQSPGTIRKMDAHYDGEWAEYAGLWEVCFP